MEDIAKRDPAIGGWGMLIRDPPADATPIS